MSIRWLVPTASATSRNDRPPIPFDGADATSAVAALLALAVGGVFAGIVGAFVAVPTAAVIDW
jgi:hypothetical protein